MAIEFDKTTIERLLAEWGQASSNGKLTDALSTAIEGYRLAVSMGDKVHEKLFLSFLKTTSCEIYSQAFPDEGSANDFKKVCSFCFKPIGNSLCVLGANVSICADCICLASDAIARVGSTL